MGEFGERVKNVFVGFLVGIGFILPGLSGAVMAVIFRIYERLIDDISNITKRIREDFWFLLTIGLGIALGVFVFAVLMDEYYEDHLAIMLSVFIGMVAGQLPDLFKLTNTGEQLNRTHVSWFIIGLAATVAIFLISVYGDPSEVASESTLYSFMIMIGIGLILGASGLIPGISATTLILVFGLFELWTSAIADFDVLMILGMGIGALLGLLIFAKIMDRFIRGHRKTTYFAVLGLTIGSIFLIYAEMPVVQGWDILWCIIAGAGGLLISIIFSKYGRSKEEFVLQ